MNRKLEEYYNNYFELFSSEGWKQLISEFSNNYVNINSVEFTTDTNDLYYRKGQLAIVSTILNLQNQINTTYEQEVRPPDV
mgnify:CR=1 FL=1|tara:strand:- start:1060 stop:1302 length:243 start_codon:yes stop_codon:yes gene_type:complete